MLNRGKLLLGLVVILVGLTIIGGSIYFWRNNKPRESRPEILYYSHPVYGYLIYLPLNWRGKYLVKETNEGTSFLFNSNSEIKQELFSIRVYSQENWEEFKQSKLFHGRELAKKDELIFVFVQNFSNPYTGDEAKLFQTMLGQLREIADSFELN